MEICYFGIEHAKAVHDDILARTGGLPGEKEIGLLEASLDFIQNDDYYPSFEEKLAHLFYCVVENHSFNDGNKRSALALGAYFLEINRYDHCVKKFIREMENIAVHVAEGQIKPDLLLEIITSVLYEPSYSEELKLKILQATLD